MVDWNGTKPVSEDLDRAASTLGIKYIEAREVEADDFPDKPEWVGLWQATAYVFRDGDEYADGHTGIGVSYTAAVGQALTLARKATEV